MSSGDDSPTPYKQIVDLYNQYCASLPKAKTITDKRKKTLRSRWKTYSGISTYEKVFQMAQAIFSLAETESGQVVVLIG